MSLRSVGKTGEVWLLLVTFYGIDTAGIKWQKGFREIVN